MGRHAKWTYEKIDEVVERLKKGERYKDLAADYGVTVTSLYSVIRRYPRASTIIRDARVRGMAEMWKAGARVDQIAETYHTKRAAVYAIAEEHRTLFPPRKRGRKK